VLHDRERWSEEPESELLVPPGEVRLWASGPLGLWASGPLGRGVRQHGGRQLRVRHILCALTRAEHDRRRVAVTPLMGVEEHTNVNAPSSRVRALFGQSRDADPLDVRTPVRAGIFQLLHWLAKAHG
jgi:hypothetical protein